MSDDIRILLLADSHLGFDLPVRPRVGRRRRGFDFLANYAAALEPAVTGEVDLVVHAGDVFDRPSVVPSIAYQAYEPLRRIADRGVPVFIVPGNHERSRLPHARLVTHPNVHVFDRARTFVARVRGTTIGLSGFPYERRNVRTQFTGLLAQTEWRQERVDVRVLCMHHCIEGATVGPGHFVFTTAADVIRGREIPREFAAVMTGHIHRHQVLTVDLDRRPLGAPVFYPGSIERTSFAEMDETKGFMVVRIAESEGDCDVRSEFRQLAARPMIRQELRAHGMSMRAVESGIRAIIATSPSDAVLSIHVDGLPAEAPWPALSSARLRAFIPETMNVEIRPTGGFARPTRAIERTLHVEIEVQHTLFG